MNEMQREVLAANGPDLRDIIVTESLLGAMYFRKIFDQEIIELIKAQRTQTEKISMVLDYLPRRGPNAFDNFVLVLKKNNSWLAIMLQTSLDNRQKKMQLLPKKMEQENEKVQSENLKSDTSQIEEEVKQLTSQVKKFQKERKKCCSLLGNPNTAQPLPEIVQQSVAQLRDMKKDLDCLRGQRDQLELQLEATKEELQDLKEKCERLESVQLKQLEKQETLYRLKEIVRELSPDRKSMTSSQTSTTENISEMYKPPTRKSKSHKLPKIKSGSQTSSSYQSPLGSKSISYHHHHHHHYSDPTVASREHTIKPSRLGSREELLAPFHKLPR